jgi:antitoxin component YwqK of YwqJK toxin-antitoxin module
MEEIYNSKYQELSIRKVTITIKKYNHKGTLSKKAKLSSIEKYFENGYITEKIDFYANGEKIKAKFLFNLEKKTLEKTHYSLDGNIEYKYLWKYDNNDRLIEEGKFHFNYVISFGKPVLGRNWRGQYNENGNLISSIQYSHGNDIEEFFSFKYDKEGKLIEKISDIYKWEYYYGRNDLLTSIVRKELFLKEKIDYSWELIYNDKQQLIKKIRYLNNNVNFIEQWEYKNGKKIVEKEIEFVDNGENEYCTYYEYDGDKIVCERSNNSTFCYKYDENKNLIEKLNYSNDGKILNRQIFIWNKLGLLKELHENESNDKPKQIFIFDYET